MTGKIMLRLVLQAGKDEKMESPMGQFLAQSMGLSGLGVNNAVTVEIEGPYALRGRLDEVVAVLERLQAGWTAMDRSEEGEHDLQRH